MRLFEAEGTVTSTPVVDRQSYCSQRQGLTVPVATKYKEGSFFPMNYYKLFGLILAVLFLAAIPLSAEDEPPMEIPLIKSDHLHDLLGGSWDEVWNWKWPDVDRSLFTAQLRKVVEGDVASLKQRYDGYKDLGFPLKLISIKRNPRNKLIYLLFHPADDSLYLDLNILYVYSDKNKWFVCKTSIMEGL